MIDFSTFSKLQVRYFRSVLGQRLGGRSAWRTVPAVVHSTQSLDGERAMDIPSMPSPHEESKIFDLVEEMAFVIDLPSFWKNHSYSKSSE